MAGHTLAEMDVLAERRRQREIEMWTPEHDDAHLHGEMALAAASYALEGRQVDLRVGFRNNWWNAGWAGIALMVWPWDLKWWKPTSRRRNLVKAAALIIAEIERIDRASDAESTDVAS